MPSKKKKHPALPKIGSDTISFLNLAGSKKISSEQEVTEFARKLREEGWKRRDWKGKKE